MASVSVMLVRIFSIKSEVPPLAKLAVPTVTPLIPLLHVTTLITWLPLVWTLLLLIVLPLTTSEIMMLSTTSMATVHRHVQVIFMPWWVRWNALVPVLPFLNTVIRRAHGVAFRHVLKAWLLILLHLHAFLYVHQPPLCITGSSKIALRTLFAWLTVQAGMSTTTKTSVWLIVLSAITLRPSIITINVYKLAQQAYSVIMLPIVV